MRKSKAEFCFESEKGCRNLIFDSLFIVKFCSIRTIVFGFTENL